MAGIPAATPTPTAPAVHEHRFRAMNTDVHVVVVGGDPTHLARAEAGVRQREARWSRFLAGSELSRLNARTGHPVIVSPDTFALIRAAVDAFHLTGGAFDPTVLRSLEAAGYDRSFDQIDRPPARPAVPAPTPGGVELHAATHAVVLPAGVGLDLGGLAKGATADAVAAELLAAGVAGCSVNLGGDVRVMGRGPDGAGWVVGLECPGAVPGPRPRVALAAGAVCTSTTGRRRWATQGNGPHEHHLRHPGTGAALRTGLTTVTVIAAAAIQAEVLTKAAFVAGPDGAADVIAGHGATGLLVLDDGSTVELGGLAPFLVPPSDDGWPSGAEVRGRHE